MTLKLGETIRQYRTERNITQEKFADYLGVTPQAVSRWENESGYPDITLLPGIATFFGVSLDVLMGVDLSQAEQDKLVMHLSGLLKTGQYQAVVEQGREAVKKFPSNYVFLQLIPTAIFCIIQKQKKEPLTNDQCALAEEAVKMLRRVISDSGEPLLVQGAKMTLCQLLKKLDRIDEAVQLVASFPLMSMCKEVNIVQILSGNDVKEYLKLTFPLMIACFSIALMRMEYPDGKELPKKIDYSYHDYTRFIAFWDCAYDVSDPNMRNDKESCVSYMKLHLYAAVKAGTAAAAVNHLTKVIDCISVIEAYQESLIDGRANQVTKELLADDTICTLTPEEVSTHTLSYVILHGYINSGFLAFLSGNPAYEAQITRLRALANPA